MSYIHQALKKAQTERDDRSEKHEEIPLSSRSKGSGLVAKPALIAAAVLGILFLAFIAYSWLDSSGPRATPEAPLKPTRAGGAPDPVPGKSADVDAFYQAGKAHHRDGRLSEAKIFYMKALKADPGDVAALNNLGVILMTEKNYPEARSRLEKALRLKPGYVDPCYNLACLFALTDQAEQGIRYLKRAVSLNPQVKAWALEDADLENLRNAPGFAEIVD
ncbi:MAG: tetratricopeptide repeat protein [Deltaproteobacteria bacterium]|nr:tetratricopeptide repeat protein [Deltaproteobacteria bacterium]